MDAILAGIATLVFAWSLWMVIRGKGCDTEEDYYNIK